MEKFLETFLVNYFLPILAIWLLLFIFRRQKKDFHSHWNGLIPDFHFSTEEFYNRLKQEITEKGVHKIKLKTVLHKQGNELYPSRRYLRAEWKGLQCDMCFAQFGNSSFASWWVVTKTPLSKIVVTRLPLFGGWLAKNLFPITFYKIDTASMFMRLTHDAVLNVIDDITRDAGFRFNNDERKPILQDVFKR